MIYLDHNATTPALPVDREGLLSLADLENALSDDTALVSNPQTWLVTVADVQPNLQETSALDPGEASAITLA